MFQTITALGLLILGFIAADWIQLNGYSYIIGIIYMAAFAPLLVREIVKLVRK